MKCIMTKIVKIAIIDTPQITSMIAMNRIRKIANSIFKHLFKYNTATLQHLRCYNIKQKHQHSLVQKQLVAIECAGDFAEAQQVVEGIAQVERFFGAHFEPVDNTYDWPPISLHKYNKIGIRSDMSCDYSLDSSQAPSCTAHTF